METRMVGRQGKTAFLVAMIGAWIALQAPPPAAAGSLYDPDHTRSMFADRRARLLGDVITVPIIESTTATEDAHSADQRKLTARAEGGSGLFGILKLVPKATLGGSVEHKGSGSTSRSSRLATT